MLPSTPSPSRKGRYVWATTRRSVESATFAIYLAAGIWLFMIGGQAVLSWVFSVMFVVLWTSYRRHRVACTDQGIELRTIWWHTLVPWREVASLETRPKHGPRAILLTKRLDPPWHLVISRGRRSYVVEGPRSLAEAICADFERERAASLESHRSNR